MRQHAHRSIVRVVKALAGFCDFDGGVLRLQNDVVKRALGGRELAISREGAGNVAGVTSKLAACINQTQLAAFELRVSRTVVQHAGVGTCGDDAGVGRVFRPMATKFVQQLSLQVVFKRLLFFR